MAKKLEPWKVFEEGHSPLSSADERGGALGGALILGGAGLAVYGTASAAAVGAAAGWIIGEAFDD